MNKFVHNDIVMRKKPSSVKKKKNGEHVYSVNWMTEYKKNIKKIMQF